MQFSEKWLRQFVNPNIDTDALVVQLTEAGLEVDSVEPAAPPFNNVVVGEVIACEQHPDADKLKVCTVDVGDGTPRQIVCGGINARQGIKVAASLVGAVLPGGIKIKKAKLRGVASEGMLCSATELGLAETDPGIIELPADAPIGMDVREFFDLDDAVIDVDLTPNRGDCASILGIAREVSALNHCKLEDQKQSTPSKKLSDDLAVTISAPDACPRYAGRIIRGINATAQSPLWLTERLRRGGIRSIHPVVDIGNYVMLELGQPLHAFDLQKINGGIHVRYAKAGEKLELLDGSEVSLTDKDLVIADDKTPLALAGVMGGLDSGVSLNTTDIFLESAFFEPIGIAQTARHHRISSDSSYRFERGVDFELQIRALERFSELLLEVVGGEAGPITEVVVEKELPKRESILLRRNRIPHILGVTFSDDDVVRILQDLNMQIAVDDEGWRVTPPSYRFDIAIEIDLIEELARIYGYDKVPTKNPIAELIPVPTPESIINENAIKQFFIDRGYFETLTYSFVDPKVAAIISGNTEPRKLLNPISSEMSVMRNSIWIGLVQALRYNQDRQQNRMRLFEIGLCFDDSEGELKQPKKIAALMTGSRYPEQWSHKSQPVDFYDLKGDVEKLLQLNHCRDEFSFQPGEHPALHPGKCAQIMRNNEVVGYLGEMHPLVQQKCQLKQKVYLFEADYDLLTQATVAKYKSISKFPSVRRDLAFVVDNSINYRDIFNSIVEHGGQLLQNVNLFDVYQGEGIADDKKSIAIALEFQHAERTLVDDEINKVFDKLVSVMEDKFSAKLRM